MRSPALRSLPKPSSNRSRWAAVVVALSVATLIAVGADRRQTGPAAGTSITGPAIAVPRDSQPSRRSIRVCTFNIHGGRDAEGRLDLDRTAGCLVGWDLIGLNEVH